MINLYLRLFFKVMMDMFWRHTTYNSDLYFEEGLALEFK